MTTSFEATSPFYFIAPVFVATALLFMIALKRRPNLPPSPKALPVLGHLHLLSPLIHRSFRDFAARLGPLFSLRLGSVLCVVASTPDLARELLKTHELTFSARKHNAAIDHLTYQSAFAFAPYGPYWKFIKKLSQTELLGARTLNQFLPIRTSELQHFIRVLHDKSLRRESVNVTQELVKYANNIISQMMLSIRSSGVDSQADEARTLIREVTQIFGEFNVSDFIWFCKNVDFQGYKKRFEDIHRRYDVLLEKIMRDREELRRKKRMQRAEEGGRKDEVKDFLDMMLDIYEDENSEMKLTREHIKALVLDIFTAGTDTSATSVEWALAELINNPMVLKKAREEISSVVGDQRLVNESDVKSLPYIQAIIKEALRLHPPIPMVARKSVQECHIRGYVIPKDTLLFVNIWAIARDPKVWANPLQFSPERFLESADGNVTGVIDVKGQHFELLPFGSGRRGCPGISLAMLELPTVLAAMIQCFDWKPCDQDGGEVNAVNMDERPGLTCPRANELFCVPVSRLGSLHYLGGS
ncbi:cytochrome P450 93B16 [Eucalyptus grandis]|nr:cytochrome P450 93B16 [Eucalyptus grandis]